MPATKHTEEQKAAIIAEYQEAAAERKGAEVVAKHGITRTLINGWVRARKGHKPSKRKGRGPGRPPNPPGAPVQDFARSLDRLIAYHQRELAKLEKLRAAYEG